MNSYHELGLTRQFSIINQKLRHLFDNAFSETGLTGTQAAVLHYVFTVGMHQDILQRDIETEFLIRRSSVTSVLQGLEKNSFILREGVPYDSRLKKIILTQKSIDIVQQLQRRIDEINQAIVEGLSPDEAKLLDNLLTRIAEELP